MTDGIIKGTGNSRYLKSVANALALYPTHESLMEALAAGTLPIDLNGINPAGWNNVGDKLDKATLLTDALCSALGLATTATPTQAMEKLRQLVNTAQQDATRDARVATGTYSGNGQWIKSKSLYFPFSPSLVVIASGPYASNYQSSCYGMLTRYGGGMFGSSGTFYSYDTTVSGNTMYWYWRYDNNGSSDWMLNRSQTYSYVGFG